MLEKLSAAVDELSVFVCETCEAEQEITFITYLVNTGVVDMLFALRKTCPLISVTGQHPLARCHHVTQAPPSDWPVSGALYTKQHARF